MPTKYDTNPLDPEFPEKAKAKAANGEVETQILPFAAAETRQFPQAAPTVEQTRMFGQDNLQNYSPPFNSQYAPAQYNPVSFAATDNSIYRKVQKIGLPENILIAILYVPWFLGMVAGLILLLLAPKSETKVRFHAAQSLAAHIGILIVTTILGVIGNITDIADIGNGIFTAVTTVMLIIFTVKAWKGKPVHIESIEDLTNWLEDKISPRNTTNRP